MVVQNAGVSGDTTAGGLARLGWALGPEADALIVTLGGNDLLRGLDPAGSRANLDGILKEAAGAGAAGAAGGDGGARELRAGATRRRSTGCMWALAAQYGTLLAEDFFAGLRAAGADPADPASWRPTCRRTGSTRTPRA